MSSGALLYFFHMQQVFFSPVRMIGAVGEDWPAEHTSMLQQKGIDTSGLQIIPGGKTFRWRGRYLPNMNDRETIEVHLNVLDEFQPKLGASHQDCRFLFLGNASPAVQLNVLEQAKNAELTVADTMDLWINIQRDELGELLQKIDGLVLNDAEAKLLAEDENLVRAGHTIRAMGPKFVVIKKGEHGAMFFSEHEMYVMPAFPTEKVLDPTGAGDSFAGGMMGHLASIGRFDPQALKEALAYGTVTASFTVEDFSLDRLEKLDRSMVDQRFKEYRQMLSF
jgi:sugar/nucleoside kinase (ribokinase family)